MRRFFCLLMVTAFSIAVSAGWSPAQAQFGKLKDKVKQKAEEKVDKKVDQTLEGSESDTTQAEEQPAESREGAAQPAAQAKGGTATAEDMALYTKYDFIPGDKVIFYDDLSREEVGEFPSRWNLDQGVFEVARKGDKNYILCTDRGGIRPRVETGPLPPKYTVEMEFYSNGPDFKGHWFFIQWLDGEGGEIGEFAVTDNQGTHLTFGENQIASKALASPLPAGVHTMRVMATKSTMKCYVDNERVANVPAVEGFQPVGLRVFADPWTDDPENPMLIGSFRFAEGGKTMKEQLDEAGRIVTHGILFDSGSARIKAESYKTLADIGQLLADNPTLRLSIEGHTDSDGTEEANLTLSQNRANAVRTYLMETYKIDGNRLETRGWGETKPIDTNNTPEGKANNRRVELVKI
jgi:OOP family OmpA-OmpF porin